MADHDKLLQQLVEKLKAAQGKSLVSVILYGSAAAGDHHAAYSDLNVFCVLTAVTAKELAASEPIFHWWREQHHPAPLLMSVEEVRESTDCFPIEFMDMRERRRVLYGEDVVANLVIEEVFYRAQVEHDLMAKLLRLRQKAAGVLSDNELLLRLMADSVSTFCILGRHALRLAGVESPWSKREIVAACVQHFSLTGQSFYTLLDLREGRAKARDIDAAGLFEKYLADIAALIEAVDRLER
jgi:predicted nucleotidyltransferase